MEEDWQGQQENQPEGDQQQVADMMEDDDEEEDILGGDEEEDTHDKESLLMRFCPHDSSMLYPAENKQTRTLQYACRLCRYTEPASDQPLIYRFDLKKEVGNVLHTVPGAVSDDPTLARSRNANCANCGHNEAVFFMSDVAQSDSLALIFVCCNCGHKWVN